MKIRFVKFVLTSWLMLGLVDSAWSQSSLYFNRNEFLSAAQRVPGNRQLIDFSNAGPFDGSPSLTISGVTFMGRALGKTTMNFGVALYNFDSNVPLGIHFASGALAFGGDFSSFLSPLYSSFTGTLSLGNGEVFHFTAPTEPNGTFFGFISPMPITDVIFSDGGLFPSGNIFFHEEIVGNLYMVTVIPEPAAVTLAGFGCALLLGLRLRRK